MAATRVPLGMRGIHSDPRRGGSMSERNVQPLQQFFVELRAMFSRLLLSSRVLELRANLGPGFLALSHQSTS